MILIRKVLSTLLFDKCAMGGDVEHEIELSCNANVKKSKKTVNMGVGNYIPRKLIWNTPSVC